MPIKFDRIDKGTHCSPISCILILLWGKIIGFTSSAKANFSRLQALLSYILSFQLAVVKALWKIFIFKICQTNVLLGSIIWPVIFQSFVCVFLLFLRVYLCVSSSIFSSFMLCLCPSWLFALLSSLPTLVFSEGYCLYCYLPEAWLNLSLNNFNFFSVALPALLYTFTFLLALLSAHSVLCWNTSFFTSILVSVYLWIQTQVYYRCFLKVTPSVHLSNGISGI